MTPAAQEQNRHRWLEALGVDSWLPRGALPGAAPPAPWVDTFCYPDGSPEDDWHDGADDSLAQDDAPSLPPAPAAEPATVPAAPRPRIDTAALLNPQAGPADNAPRVAPVRPAPAPVATTEAPRFKLAFLLRQDLLIIDTLPPHQRQGFSREHRTLLTGITAALGVNAQAELSDASMVSWPMLTSRTLNQSVAEAQAAVRRKLERTLKVHGGIRHLLLMGEAAAHWVLEERIPLDELQGRCFTLPSGVSAVVTLSLTELLRLPERKAEAWRDIQPLRVSHD